MKVYTFGCRLNIFESSVLQKLGHQLPDDVIVVNTCAVTGEAERQCRQLIRKIKKENPNAHIIVTGCAAQLNPEIFARMDEVDRVLGNREKLNEALLTHSDKVCVSPIEETLPLPPFIDSFDDKAKGFLQIQQGCDHACTFCVVRKVRGKNTGLLPDHVIKQASLLTQNGYAELIITGVDVTSYPYGFNALIRRILAKVPGLKRLRFGSLDPAALDDEFVDIMASDKRLMPHLHLSIQAGDNLILKRMGRRHTREMVLSLIQKLREKRPEITIGADFITGFPTETEEQFLNTLDLVQTANITHLHVFPYSIRTNTPAAKMPMVDVPIRKERAHRLRALGNELMNRLLDEKIGQTVSVLMEQKNAGQSENCLPVRTKNAYTVGTIHTVQIQKRDKDVLVG